MVFGIQNKGLLHQASSMSITYEISDFVGAFTRLLRSINFEQNARAR